MRDDHASTRGAVIGAVIGGVVGAQVGDGPTAAIILGTLAVSAQSR